MELIEILREKRSNAQAELRKLLELPTAEKRDLNDDEDSKFAELRGTLTKLEERIADLEAEEVRAAKAAAGNERIPEVRIKSEPLTYDRHSKRSYFLDLVRAHVQNDQEAHSRLQRHAQEMDVELRRRAEQREAKADEEMRGLPEGSAFERRVNPNRTDGQGGYFVPPTWLIDEYIPLARAGRVFADQIRNLTLPEGTDSINIPKIATGTATAIQTADAAAVQSTDLTDTVATAGVKTIAGQQDVALQLLEQSPVNFDEVVIEDLTADYNTKLDVQLLAGSGSSNQLQGINGLSGTNSVTYTDGTPTGPELFVPLGQALSLVATNRFRVPSAFFMHPRRWFWLATQLDSNNRPLVVPVASGMQAFNGMGIGVEGSAAEGLVGYTIQGIPVYIDPSIPTNQGAGTNEDRIYAVYTPDLLLWEGNLRTRVLQEVLSGTLQVRIQVYNYVAFMPDRFAKSTAVISGTGLVAPAGF